MSQPRVRALSAGRRRGTARPIPSAGPWWTRGPRSSPPRSGPAAAAPRPAAWLGEVGRADRQEATLAGAAAAMQTAVDEAGVFAAGPAVLGVVTIWSATLGEADASTAELLGRLLGGALAAHRARADGRRNTAALAATASAA